MRRAVMAVEAWMDDESELIAVAKGFLVLGSAAFLLIALFAWLVAIGSDSAQARCLDSGGAWTRTGTRRGTRLVGKILVPHTYAVYGCVEVTR